MYALRLQALFSYPQRSRPPVWECFVCGYQSSSIVGTVMEHTHLPLRLWFLSMYLLTQHKNAISALALGRQLGVSYKTAWLLKHKLMQAISQRDARYLLHRRVEIDDACLGGERAGQQDRLCRGRADPHRWQAALHALDARGGLHERGR